MILKGIEKCHWTKCQRTKCHRNPNPNSSPNLTLTLGPDGIFVQWNFVRIPLYDRVGG